MSPVYNRPLTRRRAQTRRRLLDAARALFAEKGISATSVEEISDKAGFTRGAFYSNFADKDDILAAVSAEEFAVLEHSLIEGWENRLSQTALSSDQLELFAERLLAALKIDREFYLVQTELALHLVRNPHLQEQLLAPRESFLLRIEEFLISALQSVGRTVSVEPHIIVAMISALLRYAIESALLSGKTKRLTEAPEHFETIVPILLEGLSSNVCEESDNREYPCKNPADSKQEKWR